MKQESKNNVNFINKIILFVLFIYLWVKINVIIAVIALIAIKIFIKYLKRYKYTYDNLIFFSGTIGSGKDFEGVELIGPLYNQLCKKVNRLNKKLKDGEKIKTPDVYSNIPIKLPNGKMSIELTEDHLLLRRKIKPYSIVYVSELSTWANQYDFNNPNVMKNFDEFCRMFRQYIKGYFIANDQSLQTLPKPLRIRLQSFFHLRNFKTHFFNLFYTVQVRNISVLNDVMAVDSGNLEDGYSNRFGFMPLKRKYDTHCFDVRYETVPYVKEKRYTEFKQPYFMTLSDNLKPAYSGLVDSDIIYSQFEKALENSESTRILLKKQIYLVNRDTGEYEFNQKLYDYDLLELNELYKSFRSELKCIC